MMIWRLLPFWGLIKRRKEGGKWGGRGRGRKAPSSQLPAPSPQPPAPSSQFQHCWVDIAKECLLEGGRKNFTEIWQGRFSRGRSKKIQSSEPGHRIHSLLLQCVLALTCSSSQSCLERLWMGLKPNYSVLGMMGREKWKQVSANKKTWAESL
jgi:hypothetical protein